MVEVPRFTSQWRYFFLHSPLIKPIVKRNVKEERWEIREFEWLNNMYFCEITYTSVPIYKLNI